jgi:hypothetical protein
MWDNMPWEKRLTWRGGASYYPKTVVNTGDNIFIVWTDDD